MTYLKNLMGLFHYVIKYYIYCPLKYRMEKIIIKDRLWNSRGSCAKRLYRMRAYKRNRKINDMYKDNMEIIAKTAGYYKIPQYKLIERLNPNAHGIIYYIEPTCSNCSWFTEFYRYFVYLLPSRQQTKDDFYNFRLFLRKLFEYHIFDDFFYRWSQFILIRIRKQTYDEKNDILNRWQFMNFYREKRLRRERNIKKYKKA